MRTGADDIFQCCGEVICFVERAVKRHFHRRGERYKLPRALHIDQAFRQQHARYDLPHVFRCNCLY